MKNAKKPDDEELKPHDDFDQLGKGVRGKYFKRYQAGTNLALLAPEIRAAFPTDAAVNKALRSVLTAKKPKK